MAAYDMIGQIALFAGAYTPRHWKRCDGSTLNIVEYRALFDIIGDTYGGDGLTTFALPNLGGRYMVCAQGVRPNLRPEAWSEILPPGEDAPDSGALGTGFIAGGGTGTIPGSTTALTSPSDWAGGDVNLRLLVDQVPPIDDGGFKYYGLLSYNSSEEIQTLVGVSQEGGSSGLMKSKNIAGDYGLVSFDYTKAQMANQSGSESVDLTISVANSMFTDSRSTPIGLQYAADYSATIAANPRSIPDVGTVELISGRIYRATATLNFGSTAAGQSSDLTVAVTGASVGDPVSVGLPAAPDANSCFTAWVSAADTVTVRFNNYSAGAIDPASGSYKVIVTKY